MSLDCVYHCDHSTRVRYSAVYRRGAEPDEALESLVPRTTSGRDDEGFVRRQKDGEREERENEREAGERGATTSGETIFILA